MLLIEKRVSRFATALSTTAGFCAIMATVVVGALIGVASRFGDNWALLFNTYLSLVAIVIAASILIAQRRDTAAIQAKLDHIMISSESDNRLVGIDLRSSREIDAVRSEHRDVVSDDKRA